MTNTRQIEGIMRFLRFKNEPTCSCCPGGIHVSGKYIETEPYITNWLWALCREIPEGDKVRISVEWEPTVVRSAREIQAEIDAAYARIAALKEELLASVRKSFGIEIGDIVLYRGKRHRVVTAKPFCDQLWIIGNPQRKDGTFGTAERHLYGDWTKEAK